MSDRLVGLIALPAMLAFTAGVWIGKTASDKEHYKHYPKPPVVSFYPKDLPEGHVIVCKDADGWFWTEDYSDRHLVSSPETDCRGCHGDRWNSFGGTAVPWKLQYIDWGPLDKDGRAISTSNPKGPFPNNNKAKATP